MYSLGVTPDNILAFIHRRCVAIIVNRSHDSLRLQIIYQSIIEARIYTLPAQNQHRLSECFNLNPHEDFHVALGEKVNGNNTGMLHAVLIKFWKQYLTDHQQFNKIPPISQRWTRIAGHSWKSRDELIRGIISLDPYYQCKPTSKDLH